MLDRIGDKGDVTLGLWNTLGTILGPGSFDSTNKATCWGASHTSDYAFASSHMKEIGNLKTRYTHTLEALGEEPSRDSILSAPVIGFGNGTQKLHKTLVTVLRRNEARLLKRRAEDVPRDDPRGIILWGALPFR